MHLTLPPAPAALHTLNTITYINNNIHTQTLVSFLFIIVLYWRAWIGGGLGGREVFVLERGRGGRMEKELI